MSRRKKYSRKRAPEVRQGSSILTERRLRVLAGLVCIVVAAWLIYQPSLHGGFILDDGLLLTANPLIKASDGVYRFWFTIEPIDYWPVTNTTLWIEWRLWGMHPTGYHVTNLILHIAASLLIWLLLRRLSIGGAFLAALLFAVHPVNVESVAWIAQRKNLLAMVFFLLSAMWYLRADSESPPERYKLCRPGTGGWYGLSLVAFVLAMLSKGSVAVLPVLLLAVVWWRRGLTRWDWVRTAPFFVIAAVLTCVNIHFQTNRGEEAFRQAGFVERLLGAGATVWFYLEKAVFPFDLAFVYPKWNIQLGNPLWWLPLSAAIATTAVLWRYRQGWSRPLLLAWFFFCVALVPVMGFTDVGFMKYSLVSDHYQHIAILGVLALAAAGWNAWHQRARSTSRWVAKAVAVGVVGTLMILTWQQNEIYRDALTLYQATVKKNPGCALLYTNLGKEFSHRGRSPRAIECYRRALELEPDSFEAHNNLGIELRRTGQRSESIKHYRQALILEPEAAETHNNLGVVLEEAGRVAEAIEEYQRALRLRPDYAEAHNNLGNAYSRAGRAREAIEHYRRALRLRPDYAEAYYNLGNVFLKAGRFFGAIRCYQQALRWRPDYAEAHVNVGSALAETGRLPQAIAHYENAVRLRPRCAEAHFGLALTHAKAGRASEALAAAQRALHLAQSTGQTALAKRIEDWIRAYQSRR